MKVCENGLCRIVWIPDGPATCAPAAQYPQPAQPPPRPAVDAASLPPRLDRDPVPPVPAPTRPLVPVPPRSPQPAPQTPPAAAPEVIRLETLDPLKVEPVGPEVARMADSLAAMAAAFSAELKPDQETGRQGDQETGRQGDKENPAPPVSSSPLLPVSPSSASAHWATALLDGALYWGLAGLAGAAGIGVPGVGLWAGWKLLRGAVRRMRRETPAAAAAATATASAASTAPDASASLRWYTEQLDALHGQVNELRRQLAEAREAPAELEACRAASDLLRRRIAELERLLAEARAAVVDGGEAADLREQLAAARRQCREWEVEISALKTSLREKEYVVATGPDLYGQASDQALDAMHKKDPLTNGPFIAQFRSLRDQFYSSLKEESKRARLSAPVLK